jgi:hypothetical protein
LWGVFVRSEALAGSTFLAEVQEGWNEDVDVLGWRRLNVGFEFQKSFGQLLVVSMFLNLLVEEDQLLGGEV